MQPIQTLIDIETAPLQVLTWGVYEQDAIEVLRHSYLLSFAYKELGGKTRCVALPDFPGYKKDPTNDRDLCQELHRVLDRSDIVIAHNGRAFDTKTAMSRFAYWGMQPPSPFKQIDTLMLARNCFKFPSNKLDSLAKFLQLGAKLQHTGKHLWLGCMNGDQKSWSLMKRYNIIDVDLLERVFIRLRPFANNLPRLDYYTRVAQCPTCQSARIKLNGFNALATGDKQRMRCKDCGTSWNAGKIIKAA